MSACTTPTCVTSIMVVDDSKVSRMLSTAIIKARFPEAKVLEAGSGQAALELLESESPEIAILDMNMPGMTGLELAAMLRQSHPQLRLAMLTANVQQSVQQQAESIGISFYRKPIGEAVINDILDKLGAQS